MAKRLMDVIRVLVRSLHGTNFIWPTAIVIPDLCVLELSSTHRSGWKNKYSLMKLKRI